MSVVFLSPPLTKPSEPGLSAAAAATWLRRQGVDARFIDASIEWHAYALQRQDSLRRARTYENRRRYTSAVGDLEQSLRQAVDGFPGVRIGVATIAFDGRRVESRSTLAWFAERSGPFDAFVLDELIPSLDAMGATEVAFSLTFQQQAPAAFRMAHLIAEHRPSLRRWLGGPLVACWMAAGFDLSGEPFSLFTEVVAGDEQDLVSLARVAGCPNPSQGSDWPWAPPLDQTPWDRYMTPLPVVPAALGRGCYWRRCSFCPDHLHGQHRPCQQDALQDWLRRVSARFPDGVMVHWTDSAVPPVALEQVADFIRRERLPILWHGFVRVESAFADPGFAIHLREGGCAMLQLGVETASPRLLRQTGKGTEPEGILRALRTTARAGIRNQVYLLFGLPGEMDEDRELTLSLMAEAQGAVHAINPSLLNLPIGSPMHRMAARHGITEVFPFGEDADLSLYVDFRCGSSHPRSEARRWLSRRFFKHPAVRAVQRHLRTPFKANHLCFIESDFRLPGRGAVS